jgi:hypothetical protein
MNGSASVCYCYRTYFAQQAELLNGRWPPKAGGGKRWTVISRLYGDMAAEAVINARRASGPGP